MSSKLFFVLPKPIRKFLVVIPKLVRKLFLVIPHSFRASPVAVNMGEAR
ncbi:MAG: hypothetical protein WAL56_24895 [Candidatus Sulfotelmatobacter sp.]